MPAGSEEKEDVGTVIGIDLGTTYSWYVVIPRCGVYTPHYAIHGLLIVCIYCADDVLFPLVTPLQCWCVQKWPRGDHR